VGDGAASMPVEITSIDDLTQTNHAFFFAWEKSQRPTEVEFDASCNSSVSTSADWWCVQAGCRDGSCICSSYDCIYTSGGETHSFTCMGCG
jgi:hypothetical protein